MRLTRWREGVRSFDVVESVKDLSMGEVKEMLGSMRGWEHYETNGSLVLFKEIGGGLTIGWTLEGLYGTRRRYFIEEMFYEA